VFAGQGGLASFRHQLPAGPRNRVDAGIQSGGDLAVAPYFFTAVCFDVSRIAAIAAPSIQGLTAKSTDVQHWIEAEERHARAAELQPMRQTIRLLGRDILRAVQRSQGTHHLARAKPKCRPEGQVGTDRFAFFAFICGSMFFASPLVSDNDQRADCPRAAASQGRLSTANERKKRKWAGNRAGTERDTRFAGAGCRTRCSIHVERQ
jgi:hypothetical protein